MVNGPVRGRCSSVSARMCLWVSHMEISAGILGLLHYIDGYLCHWRIRVHSCEHMWAGAPRSTMYQCVSVEVGVTESGLGWAKWSRMKHVFCAEWDWIKRPTYRITSPQPLHITSPMHTIPYAPPPTHLDFNLSLELWTCSQSKVFPSISLPSQITKVSALLHPSAPRTLFPLHRHACYMFSIILPSILTINTGVSATLSASWQSSSV